MADVRKPPFRAEHVGSMPRPARLMDAREAFEAGKLRHEELKRIEAECIAEVVAMQERVGIGAITDGEYPKSGWSSFLFEKCDGFGERVGESPFTFTMFDGSTRNAPGMPKPHSKIRRREPLSAADFSVLKSMTKRPIKANLPTPSIAYTGGDGGLAGSYYKDRASYFADVIEIMQEEIADLASRGCTYLQMDEVPLAVLCDPNNRERLRVRGEDPDSLIDTYIDAINGAISKRPADMTVCVHMCRGNVGHGMADGGYEPIAERLFGRLKVDGYFLEYDTPRAGDFAPLRFVPKTARVVLGLMTTKLEDIESEDSLKRRLDEASKVIPLDQLGLSPQCGFSSSASRTSAQRLRLALDQVERKLARLVKVADQVWG